MDAALGARLARRFSRDAGRLADAAGVVIMARDLRPRTLLYAPPRRPGDLGAAVLPAGTDSHVRAVMVAVAVGLHLDGSALPAVYLDGTVAGADERHRAAHAFARAFVTAALAPDIDHRGRVLQAG